MERVGYADLLHKFTGKRSHQEIAGTFNSALENSGKPNCGVEEFRLNRLSDGTGMLRVLNKIGIMKE